MAFKKGGSIVFASSIAVRAIIIGALGFLAVWLIGKGLYASAFICFGLAVLIAADLARAASRTDRLLEQFFDGLSAGDFPRPSRRHVGFARLTSALERVSGAMSAGHAERERRIGYLQALLDTVNVALFILQSDGQAIPANTAARQLSSSSVYRLEDIALFDGTTLKVLRELVPGARQIISLTDGRQMLASAAKFSIPGNEPERLIALQRIVGDLDVVEMKAWQDVAHVLAHEIMNSLTPISSLSESLGTLIHKRASDGTPNEGTSAEIEGAIEAIKRRSSGLMDFVERYRKLADLPHPKIETVRMASFSAGVERLMSADFREASISYESHVSPPDASVNADPALLEQAVINLLRNAIEAVQGIDGPTVKLSCSREDAMTVITVSDNGSGLPRANPDQIFVPFFTTKPHGSGIGLSLARQIALAHGGQLEAMSNSPNGAVFRLKLP